VTTDTYPSFAERLQATGFIPDPWLDGVPRFSEAPLVVPAAAQRALYAASEALAFAYQSLARLCAEDESLLTEGLGLSPVQQLLWHASAPAWHGIARADVFVTGAGLQICEINSDTPSGEPEAVVPSALAREARPDLVDPNADLARRFVRMVEDARAAQGDPTGLRSAALVYPTELTEDLGMIALYRHWLEQAGYRVELGSPYNLVGGGPTGVTIFGVPCDVVVRHYKTDWWTEREPVWTDAAEVPDAAPLDAPLTHLLRGLAEGRVSVVNPLGAVVTQNKRSLALLWELRSRLPPAAAAAVERYVPFTARLEMLPRPRLEAERPEWVLKSDYGCEGDEVILGASCTAEEWSAALAHALPRRWVAQRFFAAQRDAAERIVNYGVYLVGGVACGLLCRAQAGATDERAVVLPALVEGT
jgi:glutathionylspermidine synthase